MYMYLGKFLEINLKLEFTAVTVSFQNCYLSIQLADFNGRVYPVKHMAGIFKAAPDISWELPTHLKQVAIKQQNCWTRLKFTELH